MATPGDGEQPTGPTELNTIDDIAAALVSSRKAAPQGDAEDDEDDVEGEQPEASSEGPDDSDEDEEGDDVEEAEEVEAEPAPEQPQSFKVQVDGEEVEVTLDELRKGYSREADYTRKTMALADEKKAALAEIESQKQSAKAEREQYKAVLDFWAKQINDSYGTPEELEKLRTSADPNERQEYAIRVADRQLAKEKLAAIEAEQKRLKDQETSEQDKKFKAKQAEEIAALHKKIPDWKDPEKWKADSARITNYAQGHNLTQQELVNAVSSDHRIMLILHDAARYHELQTKKPVPTKTPQIKTVQPVKPGAVKAAPNSQQTQEAKLIERAKKSGGKVNDIAAIIAQRRPRASASG